MRKSKKEDQDKLIKANRDMLIKNRHEVARALEILFASGYISKKRLYLENFLRGMFFTIGGVLGATFVIGALIWFLSLFDQIPLLGPVTHDITQQIKNADK